MSLHHVAPLAGARIETGCRRAVPWTRPSPPSRGRGLKRLQHVADAAQPLSPPSRGRGLKQLIWKVANMGIRVAPLAGARIETASPPS